MITGKSANIDLESNPRLVDGAKVCGQITRLLGHISDKTWSGNKLRFHLSVASRDIYKLRMSIIRFTLDTEFEEVAVTDVDLTVVPCVFYVTMTWRGQE